MGEKWRGAGGSKSKGVGTELVGERVKVRQRDDGISGSLVISLVSIQLSTEF